jgi:N-acetylglucosamine-6-phosphate deacetylase
LAGPITLLGSLLLDEGLVDGALVIEGGRVADIRRGAPGAAGGPIVAPGFVELQTNGGFGVDLADGGDAIARLAAALPRTGVTSFLPTLVSAPAERYGDLAAELAAAAGRPGARALGFHLEGPFLAAARAGAHDAAPIERADDALVERWIASGAVSLVTLAPERPGARDRIARLAAAGVVVSLGHTDADFDDFRAGVDAGATLVTHLYNAMSPFGHRAPGAVGGALTDPRVAVGLIADGVHCHPAALRLARAAKGPGAVVLTTDAMAAAGMPPGRYRLGGRDVVVDATSARLDDGTLAGSLLTMDAAVRTMIDRGGATVAEALAMASTVPARVLGLTDRGVLRPGAVADVVVLDRDALAVRATYVAGELA